jgi:hypothetical protein
VEQARIRAYREYYYRPSYIVGEALKVRRLADLQRLARGANSVRARLRFFRQATGDGRSSGQGSGSPDNGRGSGSAA